MPFSLDSLPLPVTLGLAAFAALGYFISLAQHRRSEFSVLDALIIVALVGVVTVAAVPALDAALAGARRTALLQNLHAFRTQIDLYKLQHGGDPPLAYEGILPQLVQATNAQGVPGPHDSRHPYGPYFPSGLPRNAVTDSTTITLTEDFPPTAASGNGGWLYHQPTGQVAIDLPDMLEQ